MQTFKNIGVVIKLSVNNDDVMGHAKALAHISQANLHILCVISSKMSQEQLSQLEKAFKERLDYEFTLKLITGNPVVDIIRYGDEHKLDVIITGSHQEHSRFNPFYDGSLAFSLIRKAACPIWLVKKPVNQNYARVLITVDAAEDAEAELNDKLIQIGVNYAKQEGAECYLVTVWRLVGEVELTHPFINTPPSEIFRLKEEHKAKVAGDFEQLQQRHQELLAGCETRMLDGDPGVAITEFVEQNNIDLVVMGTLARSGIQGLLMGNTAETIMNQVSCSILAIKPSGFVSPILR